MTETTAALDDGDFMKALLDLVIPPSPSGQLPGAGALGLESAVATALQADPLLGSMVEGGGAGSTGSGSHRESGRPPGPRTAGGDEDD